MTQKELAYIEDAIGHENKIISICDYMINNLEDEKLVAFITTEIKGHQTMEKKLKNVLEAKSNG